MTTRTLFDLDFWRFRIYGFVNNYIAFGVMVGRHTARIEIGMFRLGIVW
jgi:regulation of enolase protein 1 (concanavalin A-like superfamily)